MERQIIKDNFKNSGYIREVLTTLRKREIMINIFLLISIIATISFQNVIRKAYSVKYSGGSFVFTALSSAFAVVFFVVTSGGLKFTDEFFVHSVWFSVSYSASVLFSLLAIKIGPLSLSALINSCSLVIPTFYGIFVLGEPVNRFLVAGIVLLLVSLVLINLEKKGERKISLKWIICIFLSFLGNGICSTVQKVQQIDFSGEYKNEFMIVALVITTITLFIISLFAEKKESFTYMKIGFPFYVPCGIANGLMNLLVMTLTTWGGMPASVMFPLISAGGIMVTSTISVLCYKEKLSINQIFGVILGVFSIALLNI